MIVNCLNCEISFDKTASQARRHPNHFCCRSCSATYNNKGKQKNKPITLVLCPNHHWEFDNNLLKLEQIPNRTNVPGRS